MENIRKKMIDPALPTRAHATAELLKLMELQDLREDEQYLPPHLGKVLLDDFKKNWGGCRKTKRR